MNDTFRFSNLYFRLHSASIGSVSIASIQNPNSKIQNLRGRRRAFTLAELMIVIAIIAILAGLGFAAMNGATNLAREHRTGAQIAKIDQLIGERYEGYRTRAVPVKILNPLDPNRQPIFYASQPSRDNALLRLLALRALMRMELPDRRTDIVNYFSNPL